MPPNPVLEEPANSSGKGVQHTALRGAALGGHAAVTRLLIDAGADGASTPRTASKRHTHWPPLNFRSIILIATSAAATKVQALTMVHACMCVCGADGHAVNLASAGHRTALMGACMRGHIEVARMLLQSGADASAENDVRHHHVPHWPSSVCEDVLRCTVESRSLSSDGGGVFDNVVVW